MNVGETNRIPTHKRPVRAKGVIEPAHAKKQVDQVLSATREGVNATAKTPNIGKFVNTQA